MDGPFSPQAQRRKAPKRVVSVGGVAMGGDQPVRVQSMLVGKARDREAAALEARRLVEAGCEYVRVAVVTQADAEALPALKAACGAPIIADIHFNPRLALAALEHGADKIRLNPGTLGKPGLFEAVARAAKDHGAPMRLGVNSGSLEEDLLGKHGAPTPAALCESALRWVERCEALGVRDLVLAVKSSDVPVMVEASRLLHRACDVPLHLGVTEAGLPGYGTIKSAIGTGALLLEGIGDTIRVSLTGDPVVEVDAAYDILRACGVRVTKPDVIACPGCGRLAIDLEAAVRAVSAALERRRLPIRVSVLGCVVNGPGEARESDFGVAGGSGTAVIYRDGVELKRVAESDLVTALIAEIDAAYPIIPSL